MRLGDRVSDQLSGTGIRLKDKGFFIRRTVTPEAEAVLFDQRGDVLGIQRICISIRPLQREIDILRRANHIVNGDVG
ncbi:hypothetical protein D3C75_1183090 [compost metagenome]